MFWIEAGCVFKGMCRLLKIRLFQVGFAETGIGIFPLLGQFRFARLKRFGGKWQGSLFEVNHPDIIVGFGGHR